MANLVAKAFSNPNSNKNKPDLFSLIQQGLQSSPRQTTSSEGGIKSATPLPSKEVVGVNFDTSNFITSMLRMVGFDAAKLGALAINALIMVASAVSVKSKYIKTNFDLEINFVFVLFSRSVTL